MPYIISPAHKILNHSSINQPTFLIADSADNYETDIRNYFYSKSKILIAKIDNLKNIDRPLSSLEEKELQFLLENLLDTKKTIENIKKVR